MKRAHGYKHQHCEPELRKPLVKPWWVQPKTIINLKPRSYDNFKEQNADKNLLRRD